MLTVFLRVFLWAQRRTSLMGEGEVMNLLQGMSSSMPAGALCSSSYTEAECKDTGTFQTIGFCFLDDTQNNGASLCTIGCIVEQERFSCRYIGFHLVFLWDHFAELPSAVCQTAHRYDIFNFSIGGTTMTSFQYITQAPWVAMQDCAHE